MPSEAELERLVVRVNGDASGYRKAMEDVRSQTNMTDGHIQLATRRISAFGLTLRGYGASAAAAVLPLVGAAGLVGSAWKGIGLAAEFEKNEVAFGTMLQSMDKGKFLMKEIAALAAETPMNQRDLQGGAKMLLQFGEKAQNIIPTLRMIGDVAGGDATLMNRLALAYGQVRGVGHVQGDELNQMLEAGFNPLREMARTKAGGQQGKAEGAAFDQALQELQKLKEQGGITFKMLKDAFKSVTSEGGQFFNGMANSSKTLSGVFSTMQDDVDTALREMGQSLVENLNLKDFVKEVSKNAQAVSEWFASINPEVKRMAAAIATATAALVGLAAALTITGIAIKVISAGIGVWGASLLGVLGAIIALGTVWVIKVGSVHEAFTKAKTAVKEFVEANYDMIVRTSLAAAGAYALVSAVRILVGVFTILKAVYVALHVQQAASLVLWAVWKVAVLAGAAAAFVLKTVLLVLNAAFATMNVLIAASSILASAAALGALVIAFAAVRGVVLGASAAASSLFDLFRTSDALAGPLQAVVDVTSEWFKIIKDVLRALSVDSKLAMQLLAAGFHLAVAQVKETLPPLWRFMRDGFLAVIDFVASVFNTKFKAAVDEAYDDWQAAWIPGFGETPEQEAERKKGMKDLVDAEVAGATTVVEGRVRAAAAAFDKARKAMNGQAVQEARQEVKKVQGEIERVATEQAIARQPALWGLGKVIFDGLRQGAEDAEKQVNKTKQAIASFSGQSLVGSAADRRNVREALYASIEARGIRLPDRAGPVGERGPAPREVFPNAGAGQSAIPILSQIRDALVNPATQVILRPARLGGGLD